MTTYGRFPIALDRGKGCKVWDTKGRIYLDFVAGIATCTLGHGHPAMVDAVTRSEEHTSELQSLTNLVCRLLLEKKKKKTFEPYLNITAQINNTTNSHARLRQRFTLHYL